jgi:signal transduction histidine kinase
VVGRNVDRLIHLTDDLLDTQRIEDGRMTLNQSEFDVDLLLNDLITDMTPLLSRRKQTLSTTNKIKGKVYGDRSRLMQVLVNLITNTHKFSPEETVITLTVESRGKNAFFSVRDMGVGLSEEEISRLFKPFPGIHVEGNTEGTGLGLSISKGIIQMHGGRIWAESNGRGKGATFSFTIPEEKR